MAKKISGKRPLMFYQEANGHETSYRSGPRIRIFYPDGHSEWCSLAFSGPDNSADYYEFNTAPCWETIRTAPDGREKRIDPPKNMILAIMRASKYDRKHGWGKMEFLGEL